MPPWVECPSFVVDTDKPWGERFGAIDPEMVKRARRLLDALRGEIPPSALRLAPLINARTGWRHRRELREMADFTGIDWRWLMIANVSYDLALAYMGCSTVALPTPEGPVLARNMDWWPQDLLASASCLLRYSRGGRDLFAIAGWPGSVGVVTGMSARGFAVVLNAVLGEDRRRRDGYPVLLFLRKVLEDAAGFEEAVAMLSRQVLFTCGLFTIVGTANDQRVCIERTPTRAELRWGRPDEPLVATNDYRKLAGRPAAKAGADQNFLATGCATACGRYDALSRLSKELLAAGRVSTDGLLYALSSPDVIQDITAQHVVMQPAAARIELFAPGRLVQPLA